MKESFWGDLYGQTKLAWQRIYVARCALQKKTEGLTCKCSFDGSGHGCRKVGRVLQIIAAKNHGMAGVVHQNCKRLPIGAVHTQDRDGSIDRCCRNLSEIALELTHSSFRVDSKTVMTNERDPVSGAYLSVCQIFARFRDSSCDFFESRSFPLRRAAWIFILY